MENWWRYGWMKFVTQVVRKRIPSGSRHWCFPYPNLGRIWTTIPAALLPCKRGSGRNQWFERDFLPPRKSDGGRLFEQLPSPGLQRRLYGSLDTGGEISMRSLIRHPKPDCHHALRTAGWHWSLTSPPPVILKPPPTTPSMGVPMDMDVTRKARSLPPSGCYRCRDVNHVVRDCPHHLDVR